MDAILLILAIALGGLLLLAGASVRVVRVDGATLVVERA